MFFEILVFSIHMRMRVHKKQNMHNLIRDFFLVFFSFFPPSRVAFEQCFDSKNLVVCNEGKKFSSFYEPKTLCRSTNTCTLLFTIKNTFYFVSCNC